VGKNRLGADRVGRRGLHQVASSAVKDAGGMRWCCRHSIAPGIWAAPLKLGLSVELADAANGQGKQVQEQVGRAGADEDPRGADAIRQDAHDGVSDGLQRE
jgi:hypothetical protein